MKDFPRPKNIVSKLGMILIPVLIITWLSVDSPSGNAKIYDFIQLLTCLYCFYCAYYFYRAILRNTLLPYLYLAAALYINPIFKFFNLYHTYTIKHEIYTSYYNYGYFSIFLFYAIFIGCTLFYIYKKHRAYY
jgi:hypothetical protein